MSTKNNWINQNSVGKTRQKKKVRKDDVFIWLGICNTRIFLMCYSIWCIMCVCFCPKDMQRWWASPAHQQQQPDLQNKMSITMIKWFLDYSSFFVIPFEMNTWRNVFLVCTQTTSQVRSGRQHFGCGKYTQDCWALKTFKYHLINSCLKLPQSW